MPSAPLTTLTFATVDGAVVLHLRAARSEAHAQSRAACRALALAVALRRAGGDNDGGGTPRSCGEHLDVDVDGEELQPRGRRPR